MEELDRIIEQSSEELGIPFEVCKKAYQSVFRFIKEHIESLPLKDTLSEEEFNKLRTNFNIPSVGKLTCSWKRYQNVKKKEAIIDKLIKQKHV